MQKHTKYWNKIGKQFNFTKNILIFLFRLIKKYIIKKEEKDFYNNEKIYFTQRIYGRRKILYV
jgi:hypothetical protein